MSLVITTASMSLDGYIAGPGESGFEHLFAWHRNGDVAVSANDPRWTFSLSEPSAAHLRHQLATIGALVVGRRLYDVTQGWGGRHPFDVPVFVVTHDPPAGVDTSGPFTFVTDGVTSAIRQARTIAGDATVGVAAGDMARQALAAGLLDEVHIDLVPVLLGGGVGLFGALDAAVELGTPRVVESVGVTHLYYAVTGSTERKA
jgi:dihydrofolate reductase